VFRQAVKFIAAVTEAVKELGKPQLSACGDTAQLSKRRVAILHSCLNVVYAANCAGKRRKTSKGFWAGKTEVERPLGRPKRR
jgi:hypothetical protein